MSAGRYSFTIEQGATLDFELAYKDSDNDPLKFKPVPSSAKLLDNVMYTVSDPTEDTHLQ